MSKKLLSLLLAAVMLTTPLCAAAEADTQDNPAAEDTIQAETVIQYANYNIKITLQPQFGDHGIYRSHRNNPDENMLYVLNYAYVATARHNLNKSLFKVYVTEKSIWDSLSEEEQADYGSAVAENGDYSLVYTLKLNSENPYKPGSEDYWNFEELTNILAEDENLVAIDESQNYNEYERSEERRCRERV